MRTSRLVGACVLMVALAGVFCVGVNATKVNESEFSQNDILFWAPGNDCEPSSGSVEVCGANLPAETIKKLENEKVKEKAQKNMARYKYAEEKTGVPWQIMATIHYREGGMDPNKSLSNGEELTDHVNKDGIRISADANKDAENAANHLIAAAKSVYGVDVVNDKSMDGLGKAFLAYNRWSMYKCANVPYQKSPYVMNFYDSSHMGMTWLHQDAYDECNGVQKNDHEGEKDTQVGALAVLAYLCGDGSSTSSSSSSGSSGSSTSGQSTSSATTSNAPKCANLAKLRTDMWNAASKDERERFMNVVVHEDASISGVEGYMNQVISKHGNDGSLRDWLDKQCPKFLAHPEYCNGKESIKGEKEKWVKEALGGSNNIRFAIGNATGGSGTGAGKIVCVWNKKANKCQDVDYEKEGGHGKCNVYSPSADFGECWGLEDEDKWAEEMAGSCGSGSACSGGEFQYYYQYDPKWKDKPFGSSTVGTAGCGPTSFAMLATVLLGKSILPDETAKIAGDKGMYVAGAGSSHAITKTLADHYGMEYKQLSASSVDEAIKVINEALKDGWMIHTSGAGAHPFSSGGHYIGIRELTSDGKWLLADSGHKEEYSTKPWEPKTVVNAGMKINNIHAVRGSASIEDCADVCEEGGDTATSIGEEGLTVEQAKQLAINYGANKNNSTRDILGKDSKYWNVEKWGCSGGKASNCAAFVTFFLRKFGGYDKDLFSKPVNSKKIVKTLTKSGKTGATYSKTPKVFSVYSRDNHTAAVVGHHDGQWIIVESSCQHNGKGAGDGTYGGGGTAWVTLEKSDNPKNWKGVDGWIEFAALENMDMAALEGYLQNGQ